MARPQKFRHSREALNDPQIAAKLGGFVLDIEALRTTRKQIDDQIAAAYDAVGDAGFEKKFVRKVVSLRAKETDARRDEEEGLEAYEFAIEKGVSLASARSKPVSSQSYAEAKGRARELTDTQEQPEEPATQSGLTNEVRSDALQSSEVGTLDQYASEYAGTSSDENPAPISNPQEPSSSLGNADEAEADSSPASAVLSEKKDCLKLRNGHCKISFETSALCSECNRAKAEKARAA